MIKPVASSTTQEVLASMDYATALGEMLFKDYVNIYFSGKAK